VDFCSTIFQDVTNDLEVLKQLQIVNCDVYLRNIINQWLYWLQNVSVYLFEQQNLRKRLKLTEDDDNRSNSKPSDPDECEIGSEAHCRVPLTLISNQPTVRSTHVRRTLCCIYYHSFTSFASLAVWLNLLCSMTRDVTNFIFAFDNMRILTTFQPFDIRRIVGGTSVECE